MRSWRLASARVWATRILVGSLATGGALSLPSPSPAEEGRVLGGYRFLPSTVVADPFLTSHFRNFTGIATAQNVTVPFVIIDGPPPDTLFTLGGDLLYVNARFEYQQRVHSRWAVRLKGGGASRVGTNGQAIISQGVTAIFTIAGGATYLLRQSERWNLSATGDVGFGSGLKIGLLEFLDDYLLGGNDTASLVQTSDGVTYHLGLRAAWAPRTWWGLTALGEYGGTNTDSFLSDTVWRFGATASMDFRQRGGVPLGILGIVNVDHLTQSAETIGTSVTLGLGFFYTGREDFAIGLESSWARIPLEDRDVVVKPSSTGLGLRYYF